MLIKTLTIVIAFCLLSQTSFAIISPRALGMGGAFTAIADDAYAAYWNPAGFAINPGVDLAGHYQMNNRNQRIGENSLALKGCFEIGMNPFDWMMGVGMASMFALEGARYLSDQGIVKKGWGREGETVGKDESMAASVKEEEEQKKAEGKEVKQTSVSKKALLKKAAKELAKGTIHVGKKFAKTAIREAANQTRHFYYAPHWYQPNYYRPTYWDNRYDYSQKDLTPASKAQFGGGITIMSDINGPQSQNTNWYTFSVASGWEEIAAIGTNLNIYDLELTNTTPNTRGLGAGFDIGCLARISNTLMFGLVAKDVLTTDITFSNGSVRRYQMIVNAGLAIKPIRQVTVAADIHNAFSQGGDPTMHYGVEVMPVYGLAVRAGLSDNNKTAGASFGVGQSIIDYAYLGGIYNKTHTVSLVWKM
ncbi:hypothetical protein ACFL5U_00760 [Candidatus Margulisiibacteriota bacterium]